MDREQVTPEVVRCLITHAFPEWAHLDLRPVELDGWDNRTMRLGDHLSVRLPNADGYVPQIAKEHRWLPVLAKALPLPIPQPVCLGEPACGFPRPWSVYRWLEGEPAARASITDLDAFAADVARFMVALRAVESTGGPPAGAHSAGRGGPLQTYDAETRMVIGALGRRIDGRAALRTWEEALDRPWQQGPVWVHGDLTASNLLVRDGRLSAVIDFGCCAVGDPACDTVMAWTFFEGSATSVFRSTLALDPDTWARGRGWALWKALLTLHQHTEDDDRAAASAGRFGWRFPAAVVIARVTAEASG